MPLLKIVSLNVRHAVRALIRRPAFAITAVATLALGAGGAITMFAIIDRLFFQSPAHLRAPNEVVRVYVAGDAEGEAIARDIGAYPQYAALQEYVRGFASLAAFRSLRVNMRRGDEVQHVAASVVTASFFHLVGVTPAFGRFFTEHEDRGGAHVAVLSHALWRSRFGNDSAVVGRTIWLGKGAYTLIGVAPAGFTGIELEPVDLWLPMGAAAGENGFRLECKSCYWLSVVGRLRPGTTRAQVATEATSALRHSTTTERTESAGTVLLAPIQEARGPSASDDARLSVWIGAMAVIVLLIACANVTNLLLARALERQLESAVRLALGVGRMRLMLELATEGLVIGILGGAAGLYVAFLGGNVLGRHLLPEGVATDVLGGRILSFTAAVTLATVVLISIVPARQAGSTDLRLAISAGDRGRSFRRATARTWILVGQMALALMLVVGAGLFGRSFQNIAALRLGFDPDRLISVSANLRQLGYGTADINVQYERARDRMSRISGVANTSLAIGSPFRVSMAIGIDLPGVADSLLLGRAGVPYFQAVSPEYFSTLGTDILHGRGFAASDVRGAAKVAVVNETMASRLWEGQAAVGKCIQLEDGACREIVGVVEDVRRNSLIEPPTMQYYVPLAQMEPELDLSVTVLLIRTVGRAENSVGAIRRGLQAVWAEIPRFEITPAKNLFEGQLRPRRVGARVFSLFGALAVVMATVGLYGILAYMAGQRTREFGIRMALGAPGSAVTRLLARDSLRIAGVGIAIGTVGALLAGRLVASMLYGVSPYDARTLAASAGLLVTVSLLASYVVARRTAQIDLVNALRRE